MVSGDVEGDGLAGECLDEDLHGVQHSMTDVALPWKQCAYVYPSFKFPVLDLFSVAVEGIGRLHVKGDGLAGECLNKDLHGVQCSAADAEPPWK